MASSRPPADRTRLRRAPEGVDAGTAERAAKAAARELLRHHLAIAVVLSSMGVAGSLGYVVLTPHGPHRAVIDTLVGTTFALLLVVVAAGARRVIDPGWVYPALFAWTVTTVVLISTAAGLDRGATSPLASLLVIQAVFVSLVLPPASVRWLAGLVEASFLALVIQHAGPAPQWMFQFVVLTMGNVMALATANSRERYRRAEAHLRGRLADAATHDGVTGCLSHRAFFARVQEEIDRAARYRRPLSLLLVDIDHFKLVNDRFGHQHGDQALLRVAKAAIDAVRTVDHVGRLGGDEFGVLLPNTDALGAKIVARRLQEALEVSTRRAPVTVSGGIAELPHGGGLRDLVEAADRALYQAKRRRDAVVAFSAGPVPVATSAS